jgi:hypothetical protein
MFGLDVYACIKCSLKICRKTFVEWYVVLLAYELFNQWIVAKTREPGTEEREVARSLLFWAYAGLWKQMIVQL